MGAKMSCEGRGREDGKWDSQGAAKWGKCSRKKVCIVEKATRGGKQ